MHRSHRTALIVAALLGGCGDLVIESSTIGLEGGSDTTNALTVGSDPETGVGPGPDTSGDEAPPAEAEGPSIDTSDSAGTDGATTGDATATTSDTDASTATEASTTTSTTTDATTSDATTTDATTTDATTSDATTTDATTTDATTTDATTTGATTSDATTTDATTSDATTTDGTTSDATDGTTSDATDGTTSDATDGTTSDASITDATLGGVTSIDTDGGTDGGSSSSDDGTTGDGAAIGLPYAEAFDGNDGDDWPAPWTISNPAVVLADLDDGRGRLQGETGITARMVNTEVSALDFDAVFTVRFETWLEQGAGFYVRQNGGTLLDTDPPGKGYAVFVEGGYLGLLGIWRELDGVEEVIDAVPAPVVIDDGSDYRIRIQCEQDQGFTRLRTRMWRLGDPEPVGWDLETTDDTPELQDVHGGLGVDVYEYEGSPSLWFDDIEVVGS